MKRKLKTKPNKMLGIKPAKTSKVKVKKETETDMNEIDMGSTASSSLSWPILSQIVNLQSGMTFIIIGIVIVLKQRPQQQQQINTDSIVGVASLHLVPVSIHTYIHTDAFYALWLVDHPCCVFFFYFLFFGLFCFL